MEETEDQIYRKCTKTSETKRERGFMMTTARLQLLSLQRDNIFTVSHCFSFEGVSKVPEEGSYCLITLIIKLYPKLTRAALPV